MLFLAALFLLSVIISAADDIPTYSHHDPLTGETLLCDRCPPGTHLAAHCTATTPTKCLPCRKGHFTELWNYLPRCLYCNNFCTRNQEVERECSPDSNRVCRCRPGFYLMNDFCVQHSECGPGHGVKTKGTPHMDTVCETCSKGYFSNSSSALDSCVKHQVCASGQLVLLPGSTHHDTVCGTCQDVGNGSETHRAFLSAFFSTHGTQRRELKRFVHRIIRESEEDEFIGVPKQRVDLLIQIRTWLAQASPDQLKELPKSLRNSDLSSMADRLDKQLSDIMHDPSCSLSM